MELSFSHISGFLNTGQNRLSKFFSFAGLCIGVMLLLCAVQMYININQLIRDKNPSKSGYDFISVTKSITNENMGADNRFSTEDVVAIKKQAFITDAAPLLSNQFRAKASAGSIIPFSTDLFLESIRNDFLDTIPPNFSWQPGQQDIPVIFSADFLEMYNVFAPAQGLPQLSASSIGAVNIIIECYGPLGTKTDYRGHIVAVTDRINSVLVPENFLRWANQNYGNVQDAPASRIFIKTKDANNPALLSYLTQKDYHVNKDKTKFGRIKQVLQSIVTGLAGFAVLVILLALMLFSFYLQLLIAKSKDNLVLLISLGYSPGWLSKTVSKKWIPVYALIVMVAVILTQLLQFLFQQSYVNGRELMSPFIHPVVAGIALILIVLCFVVNYRLIRKLVFNL